MKYVNKGFRLKGITIGQIINGGMVIGIDDDERNSRDIAILTSKYAGYVTMQNAQESKVYGLKEYKDCTTIKWINSSTLDKYKYKNINKRIN